MKIVKNNNFLAASPLPQRVGYFTQFEMFNHVGRSRRSHINLSSEIVNLK